jgi:hypothetical protein
MAMPGMEWRYVPVGLDADRWVTRTRCRIVLVVVHTVTSGQRLMDVVRLLGSDMRIQVIFTAAPDVFSAGVSEFLGTVGGVVVSWLQATQLRFDLALAASYGSIDELHAPLIVLPHGAGYGKLPVGEPRHQITAARQPYGLDAQRLVRDGRVIPAAIVLPHDADLTRLARTCPDAVAAAVVAGDPCYDILSASGAQRHAYRRCLAVADDRKLIVVTSTWGPRSLFGQIQELLPRLLIELPADEFRVVALIHPNVWYGHGIWQVRAWLETCLRRGLGLLPPEADWRAAMVAADCILADHGSLGVYGAVVKVPLLLTASVTRDLDPDSANAALAQIAPRLHPGRPLRAQLSRAAARYRSSCYEQVAARITSQPGRFDQNMRRLMYRLLRLRRPAAVPAPYTATPPFLVS